jgi:hypothetical protein
MNNPATDVWVPILFGLLFTVPAIGVALYCTFCRITAEGEGLTFRGLLGSRFVAWREIEDYELRVPSPSQSKSRLPIGYLKIGGRWRKLSRNYYPYDSLLERIQQEAKWSVSRQWKQNDIREDGDWPKTFAYPAESGWTLVRLLVLVSFLPVLVVLPGLITKGWVVLSVAASNISITWSGLSLGGRALFVATLLSLPVCFWLMILAPYPAMLTRRRYLGQKIVASHEGLSYFKDGSETFIRWEDIESYHLEALPGNLQPTRRVVESRRSRIEFVSGIMGDRTLMELISTRATKAKMSKWRHLGGLNEDVLGGAASLWKGGNVGIGPQIHHYRTRSLRAFLWLGGLYIGIFCFQLIDKRLGNGKPMTPADFWFGVGLLSVVCLMTLFGLLAYYFASVRCEEEALVKSGIFGEKSMRWSEMTKLEYSGYVLVITGEKRKMRVAVLVADSAGLKAEIEKRSGLVAKRNDNAM